VTYRKNDLAFLTYSGLSRVWQAWHVLWAPLWRGRKNCLAKNKIFIYSFLNFYFAPRAYINCKGASRDGFRERRALGHCSFWGPMLVLPIWSLVLKTWKYPPLPCIIRSKFYLLWCRLWFYDCLKSATEIRAFPTFLSTANVNALFSWNLQFFL